MALAPAEVDGIAPDQITQAGGKGGHRLHALIELLEEAARWLRSHHPEKPAPEPKKPILPEPDSVPKQSSSVQGGWRGDEQAKGKIPPDWGQGRPNSKGEGCRWENPNYNGDGVRVDKGDPNSDFPSQRQDHVIVRSGGRVIGADGKPIEGRIKDDPNNAHIPLSEWLKWKSRNEP